MSKDKGSIILVSELKAILDKASNSLNFGGIESFESKSDFGDDVTEYRVHGTLTTIFQVAPQKFIDGQVVEAGNYLQIISIGNGYTPSIESLKKNLNESICSDLF